MWHPELFTSYKNRLSYTNVTREKNTLFNGKIFNKNQEDKVMEENYEVNEQVVETEDSKNELIGKIALVGAGVVLGKLLSPIVDKGVKKAKKKAKKAKKKAQKAKTKVKEPDEEDNDDE